VSAPADESHEVVFVEIPTGARNKYEYDPELGAIVLDRRLFASMAYPTDYGFVEGTLGEDDDPLDALVLVGEPTFPGCRIRVRPVGVIHMVDERRPDEKVICVPVGDPLFEQIREIDDVSRELRREIEHFFKRYKELEEKETVTKGFGGRNEAIEIIEQARARFGAAATGGTAAARRRARTAHPGSRS
jgi:inorganic pyrophosphatase